MTNVIARVCNNKCNRVIPKKVLQFAGLCLGLLLCSPAHSQNLGRISGIVTDTSGGAVAGASVTVTDVGRGIPRAVTTDATGTYSAPNIIPGTYSVHVVYMGFRTYDRQDIQVGVGGDVHVDLTLQPGEQTQAITVTGEAPAITTTNAQLQQTITGNSLGDLPIAGHQYLQLLSLLPSYQQTTPGTNTGRSSMVSNGLRGEYTMVMLDGLVDTMTHYPTFPLGTGHPAGANEQAVMIPSDAIDEFNVIQNSKAEYGWGPGAQINIGIKSGTNAIHGTAYALGRDGALTARNPFATIKPPVALEDYGGSVSGPIKKDKLFYLLGYEGERYSVGNPRLANVPMLLPGVPFSKSTSIPDAITDLQAHSVPVSPLSMALAGCVLGPPVKCTPNAGLFSNNTTSPNFLVDFNTFGGTDNGIGKLDYHLNDHNNLAVEFFDGDGIAVAPVGNVTQSYWSTPVEVHTEVVRAWWTWVPNSTWVNDARFGWDHVLMPSSASYDCTTRPAGDNAWIPGSGAPDYAALGFVGGGSVCGFPTVTITGFTGNVLGNAQGTFDISSIARWEDSLSWTHGNHITKFGGEFANNRGTLALNQNLNKGTLSFNTNTASLCAYQVSGACGSSALQNFMAGIVSSGTLQTGTVQRQFTYPQFALFIQDDWRILPRLTINLGLRYESTAAIHEVNNLLGNIALGTPTGIIQQGQGTPLFKMDRWAFGPRFGLAWDVTGKGKTVVRIGFNIIYQDLTDLVFTQTGSSLQAVPTGLSLSNGTMAVNDGGSINLAQLSINPPSSPIPWSTGVSVFGNYVGTLSSCSPSIACNIGGVVSHLQYPEVLNWNFGVQHAITNSLTLDVSYVGNHAQHLTDWIDINQPLPGSSNKGQEQTRRPYSLNGQYPWFGQMGLLGGYGATSNYNGLQVVARERVSHGLTFIASYTYSHSLDITSGQTQPQDSRNPNAEYGSAAADLRHRFSFGPSYNIPGKPGYAQMLQGWQLTSVITLTSGRPMSALDGVDDISGTGEGQDRWTLAGDPHDFQFGMSTPIPCFAAPGASSTWTAACTVGTTTQPLPQACINAANSEANSPVGTGVASSPVGTGVLATTTNTGLASLQRLGCYMMGNSVIVPPAQGTFGNMIRYGLTGVGYRDWDMSIMKSWRIKERISTQFKAEFYNVTNATRFSTPIATLNTPAQFGAAQSTPDVGANSPIIGGGGPRKIELGLKVMF
jgi:hypothetical protein